MREYLETLNLIDLISEKHKELRKEIRNKWSNDKLCDNKLHLISMLTIKKMTISEAAKLMNLSRQAIHKFSKSMVEEGLIKIEDSKENNKEKFMILTELGSELYNELLEIKLKLEEDIEKKIGLNNFKIIKKLLQESWL